MKTETKNIINGWEYVTFLDPNNLLKEQKIQNAYLLEYNLAYHMFLKSLCIDKDNLSLIVEDIKKTISLSEAYNCKMTLTHLNGKEINVSSERINIFGEELDCYRKLKGFGMPILGTDNKFGDLIIKFKVIMPDSM